MAKTCSFTQLIADSNRKSSAFWKHLNTLTNRASNMKRSNVELNINGTVSNDGFDFFSLNQLRNWQLISDQLSWMIYREISQLLFILKR